MLAEEVMLFGLIGMLTSAIMGYFVTEGKNLKMLFFLVCQGALTGWLAGTFWIFLTGGLQVTLLSLVLPVFISAFISFLILDRVPAHFLGDKHIGNKSATVALVALFALCFLVAYSAVPVAFKSTMNTQEFSVQTLDWDVNEQVVEKTFQPTSPSNNIIPITITSSQSSTTFGTMSENPTKNSYYQFSISFSPEALWSEPYVKIAIYADNDGNGKLSSGDILWSDADYKLSTTNSLWRINCLWENCSSCEEIQARYGMFTSNSKALPIFHAQTITKFRDETNVRFMNTPEGFTPQNDMLTWVDGTVKERIINYASISPGETSIIQGEAYCSPEHMGKNLIIVQTYCACSTDPFGSASPMEEKIIPFSITPVAVESTVMGIPPVGILIMLGLITFIAFLVVKREGSIR
jgi:hypothetical protein